MIDVKLISEEDGIMIARAFLPLIQEYYENEENQKEFEKWLKERKNN